MKRYSKIGIDQVVNMQQLEKEYSIIRKQRTDQIKRIETNSIESIGIDPKKSDVEDSKIEVMKNASDSVAIIKLNNEVLGGIQSKPTSDNLLGTLIKKDFFLLKMMNVGDVLFPQLNDQ